MTDVRDCKDALARLAADDPIARAVAAVDDLRAAARFAEEVGTDGLADAVAAAEGRRATRGRAALRAFERYRAAAAGDRPPGEVAQQPPTDDTEPGGGAAAAGDHFQRGHDSHLGRAFQAGANDTGDPHR